MLQLQQIRKSFAGRVAVDGLSLDIRRGEIFGLLGPNGAGKSTTINLAVGLMRSDSGHVLIDVPGVGPSAPSDPRARACLGVAPQALALYDDLSAEENLKFFARLYALRGGSLAAAVDRVLRLVGLEDRRRDRLGTFSGGMKRRLNLATALLHDPPLLLLDEPTVGVDPQSRHAILELVLELKRQGRAVLYTTHYMEEAQRLCDRVGIVDAGALLALGAVEELVAAHGGSSTLAFTRDGAEHRQTTADPLAALSSILASGGVTAVRIDRPNLESVFLSLTGRSLRD